MLSAIVMPADEEQPLRLEEFEADDLDARQRLVGGTFQLLELERPPASLYVNDDGKLLEMPLNRRATLLLWVHNRAFRRRDVVVGDAFVLGYPDDEGNATSAPQELVDLLLHGQRYRVLVQHQGEVQFYGTLRTFGSWIEAYGYAIYIDWLLTQVEEIWVVAEDGGEAKEQ